MHKRSAPVYPVSAAYAWVFLPLFSWISCAPVPRFTPAHAKPFIEKKTHNEPPVDIHDTAQPPTYPSSAGELNSPHDGNAAKPLSKETAVPSPRVDSEKPPRARGFVQKGMAAWYGDKFNGRKTASGERFNMHKLTAAHRTLPFNTLVKVTNLNNKASVVVRINDRGPFVRNRIIDLSRAAARKIGLDRSGTAPVRIELAEVGDK